ncbi:hypothetical protein QFC24_002442 [Naganishia onofrii]|uniref:Uncharacterized protein n=1 Tax=Naganishia onofrii TaxID=1851511 RepID=A0ACC2XRR6_9TREE|nr:hypothetical protein QFC24_002442 [Naganishia onofrii]
MQNSSGSLIKNRKTYFENFALGLHKYATGSPGTIGSQLYGDVIIAKQVTRETLLRFLELPLMWDKDGSRKSWRFGRVALPILKPDSGCLEIEWDVSPLKQISKITIEAGGEIVNDAFPAHRCCVPLLCNPRGLFARMFTIEFHRGSITDGFEDTIKHIFDMNDSLYDPMQEPETPYVKILILDGIMGLRRFISVVRRPPYVPGKSADFSPV